MIKILNYGMGNCGSIHNMIRFLGDKSEVVEKTSGLKNAKAIISPGVGSFDHAMEKLKPFIAPLEELVLEKKVPFLGICLGMQILFERSAEGTATGLGWIEGDVIRFDFQNLNLDLRIPHMGWNEVKPTRPSALFPETQENLHRFYFVHSYHARCKNTTDILATTHYGYDFPCAVQKENIFGVQFHPEKSHRFGKSLFQNFLEYLSC
ncbi:MAG: imidazole glycerol phosphate synthase subunit HisH [Flavobacteriales bacterium]|nr:imidazole glycerol phosphate synthase subunit HisH [Flavobacteriales bacterium]